MKYSKYIWNVAALLLVLTTTSCQKNDFGDNTAVLEEWGKEHPVVEEELVFNHPCALYTAEEFTARKELLASPECPQAVTEEFNFLKNNTYTGANYQNQAHVIETIVRGSGSDMSENYLNANKDFAAAYQFGLLYRLTGDKTYAAYGIYILNEWAKGCKGIYTKTSDCRLAAGVMGFQLSLAAEMLRDYDGWGETEQQTFQTWLTEKFYQLNHDFLVQHNNTKCGSSKHYWSNWDLVNLASMMQIGIFLENEDIVNEAKEYFISSGQGNGNISNLCLGFKTDPLGSGEYMYQNQESGRDQGHAMMSTGVAIQLCQAAWALYQSNPTVTSLDFYSANDNAILRMAEYVAMTNTRDGSDSWNQDGEWICSTQNLAKSWTTVGPFCSDTPQNVVETTFANDAGRGKVRCGWETIYNHYKYNSSSLVEGSGFAYAKKLADKMRPENGPGDHRYSSKTSSGSYVDNSGAFDVPGFGTLMMYQGE